jgi:flagellar motor switch protein FliN/FliY
MPNDEPVLNQDEIEKLFSPPKSPAAAGDSPSAGAVAGMRQALADAGNDPPPSGGEPVAARAESIVAASAVRSAPPPPPQEPDIATQDIEYLLSQAEKALESVNSSQFDDAPTGVSSYSLQEFSPAAPSSEAATLDLIRDVELDLKIELGRTHMYLEDVLKLRKGSVVPLDKMAGDPVDIYVNGRLIARGEVLVLNDNFCVRVAELIVGANVLTS